MSLLKNLKDPLTDLLGLAIMLFTAYEIKQGEITWLWEGYAGMGIGLILFLFPDELIIDALKKVLEKFSK